MVGADEAKQMVLHHRKSQRKARLIAAGDRFFNSRSKSIAGRIEPAIIVIPINVSVKVVSPRFCLDQDDCTVTAAKLSREVICNYLKFFYRRDRRALAVLIL